MKTNKSILIIISLLIVVLSSCHVDQDTSIKPVDFINVSITDNFWKPRIDTNVSATIPYFIKRCQTEGRFDNFKYAAGIEDGKWRGTYGFDDSDVYKLLEGMSYTYNVNHDENLRKQMDEIISVIGAAQCDDGYLYTASQLHATDYTKVICSYNKERYDNIRGSHELYNMGHLYEAAVAHYIATGQRNFLDIAVKSADHMYKLFGPGANETVIPGHQEIEIGLLKLAKVTGDEKYTILAKAFLDRRGNGNNTGGDQNDEPVINQKYARGHSVRANYMYTAMADVAILLGDSAYCKAVDTIWNDVVGNKMYITGGMGSMYGGECYGAPYDLVNASYCETCAAIAGVYWNQRMFLLHGQSKYYDVLERILYNGLISGISLDGTTFFYTNPMIADGVFRFNHQNSGRFQWFRCTCCPSNDIRFMSSISGYMYATSANTIYENLYISSDAQIDLQGKTIKLTQSTDYPWDGHVKTTVSVKRPINFELRLRIPLWTQGKPVPSDLYSYINDHADSVLVKVNGNPVNYKIVDGYASINRKWKDNDIVELDLPMTVREVVACEKVKADSGLVAIERGPIVYCFEEVDNGKIISPNGEDNVESANKSEILIRYTGEKFEPEYDPSLLGGIVKLSTSNLTAVPYCVWNNRGDGQMSVWMKRILYQ